MTTLNSGNRLTTMLVDHFAMCLVMMVLVAPGMIYDMMQTFGDPNAPHKLFLGNYYLNIFAFSLYFNKDIYLGRSIAKRMLKLQVVDNKTNKPANPLKCFVRNLTVILWPIEVVVALINNERRIGDFIAGTKLTPFNPEQHSAKANWMLIVVSVILSMVVTYLTMFYPFEILFKNSGLVTH